MSVLVTGGAGYIGSHMTYALVDAGEKVVVLDNLSTGVRENVSPDAIFVNGDVGDRALVSRIIRENGVTSVIHFAGSIIVPESMEKPLLYYGNNTQASLALISACVDSGITQFIFSSTAAVYGMGTGSSAPIGETAQTEPINPYGRSKLLTEWILRDTAAAHDFRYVALRYFNVAGADPKGRTGQSTPRATHLIKRAAQVALGKVPQLDIFGTDYPTADGTAVRDYIHVSDLVHIHRMALDHLRDGGDSNTFNCGYGRGASVLEVVSAMERVTGKPLAVSHAPRRAGDPASLVADCDKLRREFAWQPRYAFLDGIVESALAWERGLKD
jgi:UDP-glucose 4-epimerase